MIATARIAKSLAVMVENGQTDPDKRNKSVEDCYPEFFKALAGLLADEEMFKKCASMLSPS